MSVTPAVPSHWDLPVRDANFLWKAWEHTLLTRFPGSVRPSEVEVQSEMFWSVRFEVVHLRDILKSFIEQSRGGVPSPLSVSEPVFRTSRGAYRVVYIGLGKDNPVRDPNRLQEGKRYLIDFLRYRNHLKKQVKLFFRASKDKAGSLFIAEKALGIDSVDGLQRRRDAAKRNKKGINCDVEHGTRVPLQEEGRIHKTKNGGGVAKKK